MPLTIQDQIEIQQLLAHYTHCADLLPAEQMRDVFAEDGVFKVEMMDIEVSGIDNIIAFFKDMREASPHMRHVCSNLVIQGDGDSATARSYLQVINTDGGAKLEALAQYADTLVKTPSGWRLQTRSVEV